MPKFEFDFNGVKVEAEGVNLQSAFQNAKIPTEAFHIYKEGDKKYLIQVKDIEVKKL